MTAGLVGHGQPAEFTQLSTSCARAPPPLSALPAPSHFFLCHITFLPSPLQVHPRTQPVSAGIWVRDDRTPLKDQNGSKFSRPNSTTIVPLRSPPLPQQEQVTCNVKLVNTHSEDVIYRHFRCGKVKGYTLFTLLFFCSSQILHSK